MTEANSTIATSVAEVSVPFGPDKLILSTGKLAKQANGSVLATVGGTVVLATVVMAPPRPEPLDFFPLTVDYREKLYAAGRIPGGYFKREGRPTEPEILRARLIDRPIRPLFPDGFTQEVQVYVNVLSFDGQNNADVVGLCAASAALLISDIPFEKAVGGVRVGFDGKSYILNPTYEQMKTSLLDLVVAGTANAVTMVESGAKMLSEEQMLEALRFGHAAIQKICEVQDALRAAVGREKVAYTKPERNPTLEEKIRQLSQPKFAKIAEIYEKKERNEALEEARDEIIDALSDEYPEVKELMKSVFEDEYSQAMRRRILESGIRADGRGLKDIRPISIEVGILPRAHGSALFTRGQTQSLGVLTLGTGEDAQETDYLDDTSEHFFYLHYNFPSFSVGEVRPVRGPGRREIGHGHLAQRAIAPVIPDRDKFPYTIRLVSEILESNGSSSMASVCSGILALMDGGVPISEPVAGIAMGLIKEGDRYAVLSDIMGLEDHLGDMDFKVAGTRDGITALRMDIKIEGVTFDIMEKALAQAKEGRQYILEKMLEAIPAPRPELKPHAPRIEMITINPEKIRDVIGAGGKIIKEIVATTGAKIDINDDGRIFIASADQEAMQKAINWIRELTAEAELGQLYTGKVTRIEDFGAFVEILPGKDGLVHISELEPRRVERVEDVCKLGDQMLVKVIGIDEKGKIRLSRKQALYPESGKASESSAKKPERGSGSERPRAQGHGEQRSGRSGMTHHSERRGEKSHGHGGGHSGGGHHGGRETRHTSSQSHPPKRSEEKSESSVQEKPWTQEIKDELHEH
ncbi:MAG: polyribonucleotide nucleotidyltransferase [Candidatus Sumerlaea chitinivorans]|nr:polyribonucleotide nucleotidyltransferase [Candidatus Sumerlaea chitinivorans]